MATIAALFERYEDVDGALRELNQLGYDSGDISIVAPENVASDSFQGEYAPVGETAVETAKAGAAFGGLAGLIAGVAAIFIPGIGPVISVGALGSILGSTAIGAGVGAATGGILGALVGMGIPEQEAKVYEAGIRHGGILVTVIAEGDRIQAVGEILDRYNAVDLETRRSFWERSGLEDYEQDQIHPTDEEG